MIVQKFNQRLALGATLLVLACSSSEKQPAVTQNEPPSVVGTYRDEYDQLHTITATTWTIDTSVFHITQVDNPHSFLIARNDIANLYNPSAWSRFDWTYDDEDDLWFCQTAYNAESEQAAQQTAAADAGNLAAGCNGFPWSKLSDAAGDAGLP